jgi:hypothetical protein
MEVLFQMVRKLGTRRFALTPKGNLWDVAICPSRPQQNKCWLVYLPQGLIAALSQPKPRLWQHTPVHSLLLTKNSRLHATISSNRLL